MTDVSQTNIPDASPKNLAPELRNWCDAWKTSLQNVLDQVSGQPSIFEIASQPLPATETDVCYTVVVGGAVNGEMTLRLPAASGTRLAQKLLNETETAADGITPEHKEALEELLRQVAGLASTTLAPIVGGEVQLLLSPSAAPSWPSDAVVCLQTRDEAGASIVLEIQISPALATALQTQAKSLQPAPAPITAPTTSILPAPASSYDRLMDVDLDVKLRFGIRRMLLREVLALSPGVVVELENTLHSPVDLLLDGRLIAKGDVVVVDGKYGLRVTDVIDTVPVAESPV